MVRNGDGAASPRGLPDGDILIKGGGPLDRGLVDLLVQPDGIGGTVAGDGTFLGALLRVANGILYDIVLDKRVGAPSVLGLEVEVSIRLEIIGT